MTYIEVKDGKIIDIIQTRNEVDHKRYKKVPIDFNGSIGDKYPDWYKNDMRLSDDELVLQGKRKDTRGRWFHKETRENKLIYDFDTDPGDEYTLEVPIEGENFQKWDKIKKCFVVDTEKKYQFEKEDILNENTKDIVRAERKLQRPTMALLDSSLSEEQKVIERGYYKKYSDELKSLREKRKTLS